MDEMTQAELILFLETLAENIEAKAETAAEAAEIIKREVFLVMKDLSDYRYDPEKYAERVRERMDWQAEHGGEEDDE